MAVAHEAVDLRVWDQNYSQWQTLAPWATLQLEHRADLSIDTMTVTLSDKHPAVARLRSHRNVPVPVTLAVNGVEWSGLVTSLKQASGGVVTVTASSDDKHLHRMLARAREATAVDSETAEVKGQVGTILADLAGSAAQRTGLPMYVNVQHRGDEVRLQVKSEDTVADVVDNALRASDTFATVRMLLPGMALPEGELKRVQGVAEGRWEADGVTRKLWPTVTDKRVQRVSLQPPVAPTPHLSWFGKGDTNSRGVVGEPAPGICWVPFITTDADRGYWQDGDTNVRSATKEEMWGARRNGWHEHITEWAAGTFKAGRGDVKLLDGCAKQGLLTKPDGTKLSTAAAAYSYIGGGAAYAWWTGAGWVLANTGDFKAEDSRRQPAKSDRVTPGLLVQTRGVRDRRHIVFSSTPGGGLESWETDTTSPEAAMIHASAQLDETVLKAIQAGTLTASSQIEHLDAGRMKQVIGESNNVPEVVEALDVSAQPFATISGTDLAYSRVGAKVNIGAAGPFFYREMTLSLGNSGTNPVGEMGREWAKAQGSTSLTLTPGYSTSCVFGDDVRLDGRTAPGWRPGDRVSFVDGATRMAELVVGYSLTKNWDGPLQVTPVLGRADNGVMDGLANRLRQVEGNTRRALTQAPRRLDPAEVDGRVEQNPVVVETGDKLEEARTQISSVRQTAEGADSAAKKAQGVADNAKTSAESVGNALSTEITARKSDTQTIRDILGGLGSTQGNLVEHLGEVNKLFEKQELPAQADILSAYLQTNTVLWEIQRGLDEEQNRRMDEFESVVNANAELLDGLARRETHTLWLSPGEPSSENEYLHVRRDQKTFTDGGSSNPIRTWVGDFLVLTPKRGWSGTYSVVASMSQGQGGSSDIGESVYMSRFESAAGEVRTEVARQMKINAVQIIISTLPPEKRTAAMTWRAVTLPGSRRHTLGEWVATEDTVVTANGGITWASRARGYKYRVDITVDGVAQPTYQVTSWGYLGAHRTEHPISTSSPIAIRKGQRLRLEAYCDAVLASHRRVEAGKLNITWANRG